MASKPRNRKAEYAARDARAKAAGFRSYAEQRKYRKTLKDSPIGKFRWPGKRDVPQVTKRQADVILDPSSTQSAKFRAIVTGETDAERMRKRAEWRKFAEDYKRRKAQMA